jgi:hypothetical protein
MNACVFVCVCVRARVHMRVHVCTYIYIYKQLLLYKSRLTFSGCNKTLIFFMNKFFINWILHQWTLFHGNMSKKSISVTLINKCKDWGYLSHHRHYDWYVMSYARRNEIPLKHLPTTWNVGISYAWIFYSGMELIVYSDILFLLVQVDKYVKLIVLIINNWC